MSYLQVTPTTMKVINSYYRPNTFLLHKINKPKMVEIGTSVLKLTIASLMILVCILNSEKSYLSLFYPTYYIISRVHISNNKGPPFLLSMTAFHAHFSLINLYKHAPVIIFILSIFITHFFH